MDRFIAKGEIGCYIVLTALKSNMDRFIVSPNDYVPNALQTLKSNMDRFIDHLPSAYTR